MRRSLVSLGVLPRPLSPKFYAMLDANKWQEALSLYCAHPWRAPPADTYELLKIIMRETGISSADLSIQFRAQVRKVHNAEKKVQLPWHEFWDLVHRGEVINASAALGQKSASPSHQQTNFVILCGNLIKEVGLEKLKEMPFSYISKVNVVTAALDQDQFELAIKMLEIMKIQQKEAHAMWPLVSKYSWVHGLRFLERSPRRAVTKESIFDLLEKGAPLMMLVSYLEYNGALNLRPIIDALLEYAVKMKDFEFVKKGIAHLEDTDMISPQAHRSFLHLAEVHSLEKMCDAVLRNKVRFSDLTVEKIERLC